MMLTKHQGRYLTQWLHTLIKATFVFTRTLKHTLMMVFVLSVLILKYQPVALFRHLKR